MEKKSFLTRYIFSTDHKVIAKQFLITGIAWAIIGGFFSVLMRLQLGYPNSSYTIRQRSIGHLFVQRGFSLTLLSVMTMQDDHDLLRAQGAERNFHGTRFMQIGARDMASPFVNMLSYWFFFIASVIMMASSFLNGGAGESAGPPMHR